MGGNSLAERLSKVFSAYGRIVSKCPLPFLLVPVVGCLALCYGFKFMDTIHDADYLTVPINAQGRIERQRIEDTFLNSEKEYYSSLRRTHTDGMVRVLVTDVDGGNIFTDEHMYEIFELDNFIETEVKAVYDNAEIYYPDICALWHGHCAAQENTFLDIMDEHSTDTIKLSYPIHPTTSGPVPLSNQLSFVELTRRGHVKYAESLLLVYDVRFDSYDNVTYQQLSLEWVKSLTEEIEKYNASDIVLSIKTFNDAKEEYVDIKGGVKVTYNVLMAVLSITALFVLMSSDWVLGKTQMNLPGMLVGIMGAASGTGFLLLCGCKFSPSAFPMPFLMLWIGFNNMYLLVSAWRCTSYTLSVEERMGAMVKYTAVSMTITLLSEVFLFGLGYTSSFRAVQYFCMYAVSGLFFTYFFSLTFLVAALAYDGRREHDNRHCFTLKPIRTKEEECHRRRWFQILCTGGVMKEYYTDEEKKSFIDPSKFKLSFLSSFLGSLFATALSKCVVKIIVMFLYVCYLGGSIFSINAFLLDPGARTHNPNETYHPSYFEHYNDYFETNFGLDIMYVYDEPMSYTNEFVRDQIKTDLTKFQNITFQENNVYAVSSWYLDFERYLTDNSRNVSQMTEHQFIGILRDEFLVLPSYSHYVADIDFDNEYNIVLSSRMIIQSTVLTPVQGELDIMNMARKIASESRLSAYSFHFSYPFLDQASAVFECTLKSVGIATICVLVVCAISFPSIMPAILVAINFLSIEIGVIGFMLLFNIELEFISMMSIIVCLGISVEIAVHMSFRFAVSRSKDPVKCTRDALGKIGPSVLKSTFATLLAMLILYIALSHVFEVFFKIVMITLPIGMFHALIVLPVVLSIFRSFSCKCFKCCKKAEREDMQTYLDVDKFSYNGT